MGYSRYVVMLLAAAVSGARANVTLASPFGDHMVLQRSVGDPIWGKAGPGESITVSFRGQAKSIVAAADGSWKVTLDASQAGGPFDLAIQGNNLLTLKDV